MDRTESTILQYRDWLAWVALPLQLFAALFSVVATEGHAFDTVHKCQFQLPLPIVLCLHRF